MKNPERLLVLLRHGNSDWNLTGRFTGWTDISLPEPGVVQAANAGMRISEQGLSFDEVHTSVLRRTYQTADSLLATMRHVDIPHYATWRLNERHYGQLQGLSKKEIFDTWGEHNYRRWWRGYYEPPPPLDLDDPRHPRFDPLYSELDPSLLPRSESLRDCQDRLLPYWEEVIAPHLAAGRRLLVISHGNTIRGLVMHLDRITPDRIEKVEIASGMPLLYRFSGKLDVLQHQWLE